MLLLGPVVVVVQGLEGPERREGGGRSGKGRPGAHKGDLAVGPEAGDPDALSEK